jgi:tetratricopeptide (TPR) repeat protein
MLSLRQAWSGCCLVMMLLAPLCGMATPAWSANPEAQRLNDAAVARTAEGNYEAAAELFTQALRLSPDDPVIRKNLARLRTIMGHRLLKAGLLQRAQEQYQAALDLHPDESAALLGLGDVQLWEREPRAAAETYRRVIALEPRNADAYARLGEAYNSLGELEAALSEWSRALALRPDDAGLRQRMDQVRREAQLLSNHRSRDSQHFRVIYEGQRREDIGQELLQFLERAYTDVGYDLGAYPPYEVQTIFFSEVDFAVSHYGLLDGKIRVGLRGLTLANPQLRSVLYHEYTHALIYAISRGNNPPRWMHEGLAVHVEQERAAEFKQEAIRQARAGAVPTLEASPYVHGSVAVEHLIERYGISTIRQLLRRMGEGLPFAQAFQETLRLDVATLQQIVRDLLVRGY